MEKGGRFYCPLLSITYAYDSQNQLIRENNEFAGKTWV